uniref:Uncharacterized protein n=1 Tax=Pipistrellus kuhlii TaxID=59472 RepID=A0A7J7VNA3_PIPKU|nr:hypothetical protein mPipKuh1_008431 [Pipistrellus kuhlii]
MMWLVISLRLFHFNLTWIYMLNSSTSHLELVLTHKLKGPVPIKVALISYSSHLGIPKTPACLHDQLYIFEVSGDPLRFNNFLECLRELGNSYNFCFIVKNTNQSLTTSTCQDHFFSMAAFY